MTRTLRKQSPAGARVALWLALCAAMLLPLLPAAAQPADATPSAPAFAAMTPVAAATAAPDPKRFSLDFVATDLVDVIKALSAQSGANIAVSSKVSGQVTLRLTDVTVEEALTVISKINGLAFAKVDSTYVIGPPEEVKSLTAAPPPPDQPLNKVLALKYVAAEDAMALLSQAEPTVKCAASPTGGLIATGMPAAIERCATLLAGIDVAPAVSVASRAVYHVKFLEARELVETLKSVFPDLTVTPAPRSATPVVTPPAGVGSDTGLTAIASPAMAAAGQTGSYAGGQQSGSGTAAGRQELSPVTMLVLSGAPATLKRALDLCNELDVAPKQVKISATITEISRDVEKRLGIDWSELGSKTMRIGETDPTDGFAQTPARDLKLGKFMRTNFSIAGIIQALVTEGTARIMANPSVTLLEGRQATIHAGDKIYYPQIVGYTAFGQPISQATEINTGVTLIVNPRLTPEGEITLTLIPSVSSAKANPNFSGYPTVTERSTVTTVRVKSGETFAIGGLIQDDETITINKVPLLGDIPLIGQLFRSTVKHPVHSEVVIIITPEVVESPPAT
jgi:type II secretory pathway component GspD/PulD (secretin)